MSPSALEQVPAPVRRVAAFTVVAVAVYAVLLAVGALLFPSAGPGSGYGVSATVAAAAAALYLVYLGGFGKLRDLLR